MAAAAFRPTGAAEPPVAANCAAGGEAAADGAAWEIGMGSEAPICSDWACAELAAMGRGVSFLGGLSGAAAGGFAAARC